MKSVALILLAVCVNFAVWGAAKSRAELFYENGYNYFWGTNGFKKDVVKAVKLFTMAAKAGHGWAQLSLAKILCSDIAGKRDYAQAFFWAKKSAEKVTQANMLLGWFYMSGKGGEYDPAAGFKCYQKVAYHRLPDGYGGLAWCYILGKGTAINIPLALENLQKGAERGDIISQWMLASCYFYGQFVPVDRAAAEYWFRKFRKRAQWYAENGAPGGYYQLGMMFRFGLLEPYDMKECLKLWKQAAEEGYADAGYAYALELLNGAAEVRNVPEAVKMLKLFANEKLAAKLKLICLYDRGIEVERDKAYAERLFKEVMVKFKAERAECQELLALGQMLQAGIGCPVDPEGAEKYFQQAMKKLRPQAENGVMFSQMLLGYCSYFGEGIRIDRNAAKENLISARALIENHAMYDEGMALALYGVMHLHGWGVAKSPEKAVKYLKRACEHENEFAAYALYEMYRDGNGVERSRREAEKYLKFAADRKYPPALAEKKQR